MSELWEILVIGYWILMGGSLLITLLRLTIPQYLYSIDEVTKDKEEACQTVLKAIEEDLGVHIVGLSFNHNYSKNEELLGSYDQTNHSITLYIDNLDNVRSFIMTLIEEVHHSVFVSSKSSMKLYQSYHDKVGYNNNPLEYSAKVYAKNHFKTIHRILRKSKVIRYKV